MEKELEKKSETLLGDIFNLQQLFFDRNTSKNSEGKKKTVLNDVVNNFKQLVTDNKFIIPLIIFVVLGYGFAFFFRGIITGDDIGSYRFFENRGTIAQDRLTSYIVHLLLDNFHFSYFFLFFSAIVLLTIGAILNAAFIKSIIKFENNFFLALASSLFCVFPIIWYIQIFLLATFIVGMATILTLFANVFLVDFIKTKQPFRFIILLILLILVMSAYESWMFIFITVSLFVLLFSKEEKSLLKMEQKEVKSYILYGIAALVLSVLAENILENIVQIMTNTIPSDYLSGRVVWLNVDIFENIKRLLLMVFVRYFLVATASRPFLFFIIVMILFLKIGNAKSKFKIFVKLLIILSLFSLTILFGTMQIPRMSTSFNYFIMYALVFLYLNIEHKQYMKNTLIMASVIGSFLSAQELNNAFELIYSNRLTEINILHQVASDIIPNYGNDASIYIHGFPDSAGDRDIYIRSLPNESWQGRLVLNIDGFLGTNVYGGPRVLALYSRTPFLQAQGAHDRLRVSYFNTYGYNFRACTPNLTEEQQGDFLEMPIYPIEGFIREFNGCVIIRFAD